MSAPDVMGLGDDFNIQNDDWVLYFGILSLCFQFNYHEFVEQEITISAIWGMWAFNTMEYEYILFWK